MGKSFQLFIILLIICIKIQNIYCVGNSYTSDQNNIYYIDNEQKYTWFDALAQCASMNMSLITIDTKQKSDEITNLLSKTFKSVNRLWIGGVVNGNDHHFVWISTGDKLSFTNWAPGEPNFQNNQEYCLETGWTDKLQWNDEACTFLTGFICEYNHTELELKELYESKIQEQLEKEKELQIQLEKSQLLVELLLDYAVSNDKGTISIHDICAVVD